jgi:hypothetical protein
VDRRWLAWLVVAAGAGAAGCQGPPPSRMRFNEILAHNTRELSSKAVEFRREMDKSLPPPNSGKKVEGRSDPGTLDRIAGDIDRLVEKYQDEAKYQQLPRLSQGSAQTLLDAYKQFLDSQEAIAKDLHEIADAFRKSDLGKARQLQDRIAGRATKAQDALEKAQKSYAEEVHLQLLDKKTKKT